MQPLHIDRNGILRFKENRIVTFLLEKSGVTLNDLALMDFSDEERRQFARLIGYSLCGYQDLPYVTDKED